MVGHGFRCNQTAGMLALSTLSTMALGNDMRLPPHTLQQDTFNATEGTLVPNSGFFLKK